MRMRATQEGDGQGSEERARINDLNITWTLGEFGFQCRTKPRSKTLWSMTNMVLQYILKLEARTSEQVVAANMRKALEPMMDHAATSLFRMPIKDLDREYFKLQRKVELK
ncbi:hypothetical protein KC19_10G135300 [Ceratodon purpureus]|uniref:Uncharacterized protein n=1 Tax=Ceratodon purpureus TaxID=3225 RepID=A0A8T0GLJ0_CERPU|nr:hypothetical protein KC19_10G135300 [Ceratodon purpureus]